MSARGGLQRLSRLLFLHQHHPQTAPSPSSLGLVAAATGRAPTITTALGSSTSPHVRRLGLATGARTPASRIPPTTSGGAGASGGASGGSSQFDRWLGALRQAPPTALVLGALGVVPFVALSTPICKHLAWLLPLAVSDRSETFQVGYGVAIASFLGGVHWGAALSSPLGTAGPVAARMAAERLAWGVVPSLLAWPLVAMEPGPAAALLSALLPALYLADRRFARRGLLPQWYMALRAPLTLGATFGCLLTASYHAHLEADREAARKAKREAAPEAAAAAKQQQQQRRALK